MCSLPVLARQMVRFWLTITLAVSIWTWAGANRSWSQDGAWQPSRPGSSQAALFWEAVDGRAPRRVAQSPAASRYKTLPQFQSQPANVAVPSTKRTEQRQEAAVDTLEEPSAPRGSAVVKASITDQPSPKVVRHAVGPPETVAPAEPNDRLRAPLKLAAKYALGPMPVVRAASLFAKPTADVQPVQYSEVPVSELIWSSEAYADQYGLRYAPCHWVRVGALAAWIDGFATPALVTTSPAGTAREMAGVLGEPGTVVLVGASEVASQTRAGGYVTLGRWFCADQSLGIEASYQNYGKATASSQLSGNNYSILARPFTNVEPGFSGQDAELVVFPNFFNGNIQTQAQSELQGVEVLFRRGLARGCDCRIDFLIGWRFLRLDDSLVISDFKSALTGSGLPIGTTLEETDSFATRNDFSGFDLGVAAETTVGRLSVEMALKLALGNTSSQVTIDGQSQASVPLGNGMTDVAQSQTGLLAQATNIGVYQSNQFSVVPELGLRLSYDLTCRLRATLGYSFLYWGQVARPGDQIDTDLNLSQLTPNGLVGLPRPAFTRRDTDVWAQTLQLGLEFRF